ncbi:glycine--tRNA ligase subunit beta [Silanimonas sp.]|uniref:glycine--tRNA ligase subunit beta n=1 Tax=Silanimonas sp. TaxID=1929290 RepID=UPI001BC3448B|nr:glycine--tRNA ligase subunit beta [Silanimonas sp.]MBS3896945.1 glycine--tRNA ligase subunit beta [Silanimonas sp.]MBS3923785.1 glycine--tRNA ligase subunit beta [Xanthomonadaceae bacterium]
MSASLLIELGTEELPVKALPELAAAFANGIIEGLAKRGVAMGATRSLYSPRRLAVLIESVAAEQPEQRSEVLGPYLNIGLDANGAPTKALEGFAAKSGVAWNALERTTDAKGERFVHRAVRPGARTVDLLQAVLDEALKAMPIPKPMRWGAHEHAFARPVLWLVALYGAEVVPLTVFGKTADRMSRGHRFMHDKPVWIADAEAYVEALRTAKVLVNADERRTAIAREVEAAAAQAGGTARVTEDNLEQVNGLVEWPKAVLCGFEQAFLRVPQEALISTMEANQKFFPVLDAQGRITGAFIGIANIVSTNEAEVRKGYERVIRPRFADAAFFFDEDLKQGLSAMNEGLASVTYQQKLGSYADKVARIAQLARAIATALDDDADLAQIAALLCKADLQSRMVGEFPELQGIAGRCYAAHDAGLDDLPAEARAAVAVALDEVYAPRFAGDAIASTRLGQILAIAERLDTLAGGFAAGLKPSGNKDPFALRRNALGLARTLIEGGLDLNLLGLLRSALESLRQQVESNAADKTVVMMLSAHERGIDIKSAPVNALLIPVDTTADDLHDFILERLRGYFAERGVGTALFDAVAAAKPVSLADFAERLSALQRFAERPEAAALAAANKRARNILKKVEGALPETIDASKLVEPAEHELHAALVTALADTDATLAARDYVAVLSRLSALRAPVDAFFDTVMVMAEDPVVRANRLALLKVLADRFAAVAAIEQLAG